MAKEDQKNTGRILRILMLEDSPEDAELLVWELNKGGIEPDFKRVDTPEDMIKILAEESWDIIIADYRMPAFNALDALNILKKLEYDLPFIIVSGAIGEETVVEVMKAGAHDYIKKGEYTRLVPAIEREIREAEIRREHQAAENALRESEKLLRQVIDATPALIFVKDAEGRYILTNEQTASLHDRTPDQMIGCKDRDFVDAGYASREEVDQIVRDDQEVLKRQAPKTIPDETFTIREGEQKHFQTIKIPLEINGDPNYVLGISVDISARQKSEEEKQEIQNQLLQIQKMEALGTLTGGVAHDFNNLLTAIHGCTDLAMARVRQGDPVFDDLREIQKATARASDLTNQLLLFSRKHPIDFQVLDLNQIINGLLKMLHRIIGEDVKIDLILEDQLRAIKADRANIEQVIMNLVVNGRDAMPDGGCLQIQTQNVHFKTPVRQGIGLLPAGDYVLLDIQDTGMGMDDEILPHIFEPFFTTKRSGKGTGLGLSVVYGIITQHDGMINVDSQKNKGSCFHIYLPAVDDKPIPPPNPNRSLEAFRGRGQSILIVEDETGLRDYVKTALTKYGYLAVVSSTAEEAYDIFCQDPDHFDLIFSDVVLPEKSGVDLMQEILQIRPDCPIVFTSGYTDQKSQWPMIQERGIPFLQKPYKLIEMLKIIYDTISNRSV